MTPRIISPLVALALAGCVTTQGAVTTPTPVCNALVGPIKYSSQNKKSLRYAGPKLAPDLAVRNRVGVNLRCPAYR